MKTELSFLSLTTLLISIFSFSASASIIKQERLSSEISIYLDNSLNANEKSLLKSDFQNLKNLQLQGLAPDGLIASVFGGPDTKSIIKFVDDRINIVLSMRENIDNRVGVMKDGKFSTKLQENATDPKDSRAMLMASNVSALLWFESVVKQGLLFKLDDENSVRIASAHIGVMQLGEGYTAKAGPGGTPITMIDRVGTFVHESRHSDCTGGVKKNDLMGMDKMSDAEFSNWASKNSCGHMHIDCPAGHPLAKLPACDNHAWGAYSVGGVFNTVVSRNCKNCTEAQKQVALIAGVDSLLRLVLSKPTATAWSEKAAAADVQKMLSGGFGKPDMTSAGVRE